MKKNMLTIVITATLAVAFYFGFTTYASARDTKSKYVIENSVESIELGIENHLNSSDKDSTHDIQIVNTIDLDNKKFVMFSLENKLGFAEISTGENDLLGVDYASLGDSPVKLNVTSTDQGRYLIAFGRNFVEKISHLKVTIDTQDITLSVPKEEFFIAYTKLDKNIATDSTSTVNMYDSFGREITVDIYQAYEALLSK